MTATAVTAGGSGVVWLENSVPGSVNVAPAAAATVLDTSELVVNGGFESGVSGWRVNNAKSQGLSVAPGGRSGDNAGVVTAITQGTVALNDANNTVVGTQSGVTYRVTAYLKSPKSGVSAMLRLREVKDGNLVNSASSMVKLTTAWQQASLSYVSRTTGGELDLNVVGWQLPKGASIVIDEISMRRTAGAQQPPVSSSSSAATTSPSLTPTATGTSSPTLPGTSTSTPAATVPTATPPPGQGGSSCMTARGVPTCGTLLGSAIGGNDDPQAKESLYGAKLGLRRTYYQSSQVSSAVRTAQEDIAAGRVPWISFKLPHSWAEMADGKGDAWVRDLASQLSGLDGPVWVAFHHEPERDGDLAVWRRMQAHLSPIVRNAAPNVAFTVVVMGWHQVFGTDPALSFDAIWPGDGLVDILAIDPYNQYGVVKDGQMTTKSVELKEYYTKLAAFAKTHGTRWAVAETGYTDLQASRDPAWLNRAYTDMRQMGGVGLSYFDSELNSQGTWELSTPEKIDAFKSALRTASRP